MTETCIQDGRSRICTALGRLLAAGTHEDHRADFYCVIRGLSGGWGDQETTIDWWDKQPGTASWYFELPPTTQMTHIRVVWLEDNDTWYFQTYDQTPSDWTGIRPDGTIDYECREMYEEPDRDLGVTT